MTMEADILVIDILPRPFQRASLPWPSYISELFGNISPGTSCLTRRYLPMSFPQLHPDRPNVPRMHQHALPVSLAKFDWLLWQLSSEHHLT